MKSPLSTLGNLVLVAALCLAMSIHYQMDGFGIAFSLAVGWFVYGKLVLAMSFTQGYGVKGMRTIIGMPVGLAMFVILIGTIVTLLLMTAYQPTTLSAATIANIRTIGWSAAVGVGTAVFSWYSYGRQAYFHESEYNIRAECRDNGDSPDVTEATVARHRANGVIQ